MSTRHDPRIEHDPLDQWASAAFRPLRDVDAPRQLRADLRHQLHDQPSTHGAGPSNQGWRLVAAAVLAIIVVAALYVSSEPRLPNEQASMPIVSTQPSTPASSTDPSPGTDATPSPTDAPTLSPTPDASPSALPTLPVGSEARILVDIVPRIGPSEDAEPVMAYGEASTILRDRIVTIIDGPRDGWYLIHTPYSESASDFMAWVQGVDGQRNILEPVDPPACPSLPGIATISELGTLKRVDCFGSESEIELEAWAVAGQHLSDYHVQPAWFGADRRTIELLRFEGVPHDGNNNQISLLAQIPPELEIPPFDLKLRIRGHFDDPRAMTCQRTVNDDVEPATLRTESPEHSSLWCRNQFVLSSFQVLEGPEGRPVQPDDIQLHRWGGSGDCAGVGLSNVRIRIDPDHPDPVWAEARSFGRMPIYWAPGFEVDYIPEPVIRGPDGTIVARDGTVFLQDERTPHLAGYAVCPGSDAIRIYGH